MDAKRTLIKFMVEKAVYVPGRGVQSKRPQAFSVTFCGIETDCFYCEWFDLFGKMAIEYEQKGMKSPARVRMTFLQEVYDLLTSETVKILRNGSPHLAYELTSAPMVYDKILEFQVQRQVK